MNGGTLNFWPLYWLYLREFELLVARLLKKRGLGVSSCFIRLGVRVQGSFSRLGFGGLTSGLEFRGLGFKSVAAGQLQKG